MGIFTGIIEAINDHTKAIIANTKVIAQNNEIWREDDKKKPKPASGDPPSNPPPPGKTSNPLPPGKVPKQDDNK